MAKPSKGGSAGLTAISPPSEQRSTTRAAPGMSSMCGGRTDGGKAGSSCDRNGAMASGQEKCRPTPIMGISTRWPLPVRSRTNSAASTAWTVASAVVLSTITWATSDASLVVGSRW